MRISSLSLWPNFANIWNCCLALTSPVCVQCIQRGVHSDPPPSSTRPCSTRESCRKIHEFYPQGHWVETLQDQPGVRRERERERERDMSVCDRLLCPQTRNTRKLRNVLMYTFIDSINDGLWLCTYHLSKQCSHAYYIPHKYKHARWYIMYVCIIILMGEQKCWQVYTLSQQALRLIG